MAESSNGDKTEAPTPQRRAKAREQGNIPRSQDLTAAVLIIGCMIMLDISGMGVINSLRSVMSALLSPQSLSDFDPVSMFPVVMEALMLIGKAMAPLMLGIMLVAVLVNLLQVGFFLNFARLQPNLKVLNPANGLKRIFGKGESLVKLAMNLAKLTIVAWVAYTAVRDRMPIILSAQQYDFFQIFAIGSDIIYRLAIRLGVILLILAILDYCWQRWKHERDLKMSKQDVKDEMKRMDGDPQIKGRRREIARQIAMQRVRKDVPTADVVVTNPTHFAVALKYDKDSMHAPKVVAKGQDYMALRIREIAVAHGIPILERPPLARGLYKLVDVGQEIPEQFYSAVAEILAYVYELTGKARQKVAG